MKKRAQIAALKQDVASLHAEWICATERAGRFITALFEAERIMQAMLDEYNLDEACDAHVINRLIEEAGRFLAIRGAK